MRRLLILLLCLTLLVGSAAAYEAPTDFTGLTLEQIMSDFMEANQLAEQNFCISFYNTVTGQSYAFNDTKFTIAASTYKLPLNMYFYEMQRDGEITGDTVITWTGRTLDEIHRESIVKSNNELSEALMYYWGDHVTYKDNMRKYFSMTDEEIKPDYYAGNYYCVRMMMDCLQYLYANQEDFGELIGYMKEAKPGEYFKRYVDDYEVAHKYGAVQIFENDVGIIYTPQPILLAVYTQGIYGEDICAQAARLLTDYTVWQCAQLPEEPAEPEHEILELPVEDVELPEEVPVTEPEPEPQPEPEPEAEPEPEHQPEPEPQPEPVPQEPAAEPVETEIRETRVPLWVLIPGGLVALGLLVWLIVFLTRRRRDW